MFLAERIDPGVDLVAHVTGFLQSFRVRAGELRRIIKRPMQSRRYTCKNWTTLGLGFTANGDHELEDLARFPNIENPLRFVL